MSGISSIAGNIAATVSHVPGADKAAFAAAVGEAVPAATKELTDLLTSHGGVTHAIEALQGARIQGAHPFRNSFALSGGLTPQSARELSEGVQQARIGVALANRPGHTVDPGDRLSQFAKEVLEAGRPDASYHAVNDLVGRRQEVLAMLHDFADDTSIRIGKLTATADAAKINALVDGIKQSLLGIAH